MAEETNTLNPQRSQHGHSCKLSLWRCGSSLDLGALRPHAGVQHVGVLLERAGGGKSLTSRPMTGSE